MQDSAHGVDLRAPAEESATGQHFVEYRAKAENIGTCVDGCSANLFWRHVADGAKNRTMTRFGRQPFRSMRGPVCSMDEFRKPEIKQFNLVAYDHHVERFDIAMNHAAGVNFG